METTVDIEDLNDATECGAFEVAPSPLKGRSSRLTGVPGLPSMHTDSWAARATARSDLRAAGWTTEDFAKPVATVAVPWSNAVPCNSHLRALGDVLVGALEKRGAKAVVASAPVISDGMTNGCEAMRYSLPSRELIADCVEATHEGFFSDACVGLCGCDKTVPAVLLALARTDAVGLVVYGGTALPPTDPSHLCAAGQATAGVEHVPVSKAPPRFEDVGEATGAIAARQIDAAQLHAVECSFRLGAGSCAGFFTANTMAAMCEALGLALPGSATGAAVDEHGSCAPAAAKVAEASAAAAALLELLRTRRSARDILTRPAFENAIVLLYALGGSTNAVLHLLALAREAGVPLELDDFPRLGSRVPLLSALSPHGRFWTIDLHRVGGVPLVLRELMDAGLLHGDALTVTGKTMAENLAGVPRIADAVPQPEGRGDGDGDGAGACVLRPFAAPVAPAGRHIAVLRGSLAPDGAVTKPRYLLLWAAFLLMSTFAYISGDQAGRAAHEHLPRPGARVRERGGRVRRGHGGRGAHGRRARRAQRRAGGCAGHARDAVDHIGAVRSASHSSPLPACSADVPP
jgi:dihydroxy-acid dehydratase